MFLSALFSLLSPSIQSFLNMFSQDIKLCCQFGMSMSVESNVVVNDVIVLSSFGL